MKHPSDENARQQLAALADRHGLDLTRGRVRRTSSRFCLGVEHGDYNGTELFGVGTDRFIWTVTRPNDSGRMRLVSANFESDGLVEFDVGAAPEPGASATQDSWARFPMGIDWVLRRAGIPLRQGLDVAVHGNIPGGGMSRSASLAINLILAVLEANDVVIADGNRVVDLAQAVENDYIGSPCGKLDQTMIYFARAGMGTHYRPEDRSIEYVPLGAGGGGDAKDLRILSLDTGTVRPGLEKSTYAVRTRECAAAVRRIREFLPIDGLADVREPEQFEQIQRRLADAPHLVERVAYIHRAVRRLPQMLAAWRAGDVARVGALFRADGHELRDLYRISGPELESMCDIVRTVPGVLGERMLGGGDKGAAGALVLAGSVDAVRAAVDRAYPLCHPDQAGRQAVHACAVVDGVTVLADF